MLDGLVRWLLEPIEGKPELKCSNCGSEVASELRACLVCGQTRSHLAAANEHDNIHIFETELFPVKSLEALKREGKLEQRNANLWYEKARSECKAGLLENPIAYARADAHKRRDRG